jgi:hypothetical protein
MTGGFSETLTRSARRARSGAAEDDGVDRFSIQGALDHPRIRDRQNRRTMRQDQGFRFGEAEYQISINSGVACADDRRQRAGLPHVAMRDSTAGCRDGKALPP